MRTIRITETLGVVAGEVAVEAGEITEVSGMNASGKTSVAVCAQAVLAHDMNPLGVPATRRSAYGHTRGLEDPAVALSEPGVERTVWHPLAGKLTTSSEALCSPAAVGLVDFTARLGKSKWIAALHEALLPSLDEMIDIVAERLAGKVDPDDMDAAVEILRQRGWDGAAAVYGDRARGAKTEWSRATARNYGSAVAVDWRPEGWHADLDSRTVEEAVERLAEARDALAGVQQVVALSAAEDERRAEALMRVPSLEKALAGEKARLKEVEDRIIAVNVAGAGDRLRGISERARIQQGHLDMLVKIERDAGDEAQSCPHCGGGLTVTAIGNIEVFDAAKEERRREAAEDEIEEAGDELEKLLAERDEVQELLAERRREEAEFQDERSERLRTVGAIEQELKQKRREAALVGTAADPVATGDAEAAVNAAERDVEMLTVKRDADRLQASVVRWGRIAEQFGSQGVRAGLLMERLTRLNAGLAVLSDTADWPRVSFDGDNGGATWGDRPVSACSESEQWRAQAMIQLTLAAIQGSPVVVLDRADVLDDRELPALMRALRRVTGKVSVGVLVCRTGEPSSEETADRRYRMVAGMVEEAGGDDA